MPIKEGVVQVLPLSVELDGCIVHILEVVKGRLPSVKTYHVAVKVDCNGVESRVFTLTVKNSSELKAKLLAEISKLKLIRLLYGDEFTRRVVAWPTT